MQMLYLVGIQPLLNFSILGNFIHLQMLIIDKDLQI